jgi:hypothetical protein
MAAMEKRFGRAYHSKPMYIRARHAWLPID